MLRPLARPLPRTLPERLQYRGGGWLTAVFHWNCSSMARREMRWVGRRQSRRVPISTLRHWSVPWEASRPIRLGISWSPGSVSRQQASGNWPTEIYGQLLDNQGNPIGGPFQVNTTSAAAAPPAAAMDSAGNFVVVWVDGATGGGIDAQLYQPGLTLRPAMQVTVENSSLAFTNTNQNQISLGHGYAADGVEQLELARPTVRCRWEAQPASHSPPAATMPRP